jgi:Flp pilus assembly protein TadB
MTRDESRPTDAERPPKNRRTVRFTVSEEPEQSADRQVRRAPVPRPAMMRDRLLRMAEMVVGDLAPTLRVALVRVLLFVVVLVVLGIALGVEVALLGAALGFAMVLAARLARSAD